MKRGRGIWTDEENKYLIDLIQGKKRMSWNEVAVSLSEKCGTSKTGKQCRERYRNYANPALEKSEWKSQEKLLFLVLHQIYGNQWSNIAKHLNQRSDVVVKNYFYSITRKAMKYFKMHSIPASLLKKSEKFYLIFSILEHIRVQYIPAIQGLQNFPRYSHKEKIILNLLQERNVTDESINEFQRLMIEKFRKCHPPSDLPIVIPLSLADFNLVPSKADELISNPDSYNPPLLRQVVVVKISQKAVSVPSPPLIPISTAPTSIGKPLTDTGCYYCWNPEMNTPLYYPPAPYIQSTMPIPSLASIQSMQSVQYYQSPSVNYAPNIVPIRPMAVRPRAIPRLSPGIISPRICKLSMSSDLLHGIEPDNKTKLCTDEAE